MSAAGKALAVHGVTCSPRGRPPLGRPETAQGWRVRAGDLEISHCDSWRAALVAQGFMVARATVRDGCCSPALTLSPSVPSCRRTVQDKMTGADIKLTDEQVDLVHRLQRGQFGDVHFDPYEVG